MLSMLGRIGHFTASSGVLDQLDVIYAGPDRSLGCAIRAFRFDQPYVIYVGPDRSFYCAIRAFKLDPV